MIFFDDFSINSEMGFCLCVVMIVDKVIVVGEGIGKKWVKRNVVENVLVILCFC